MSFVEARKVFWYEAVGANYARE